MTDFRSQSRYQVRLGWGIEGTTQLAKSGIVIVVDAIGSADGSAADVLADFAGTQPHAPTVFIASLRNAGATAIAVYDEQLNRCERTAVNLVLVGDEGRFAVEDYLAAGAVANALSERGLDHSAPDAAVAIEGFRPLKRALKHLFSPSATGLAETEAGRQDEVRAAAILDAEQSAIRFCG